MNILLSYPHSGNHLVRFFIELLSEKPTFGCGKNNNDVEIYRNKFDEIIPFNIGSYDKKDCYHKFHLPFNVPKNSKNLILIVRNPNEVLLRAHDYKFQSPKCINYEVYFNCLKYYNNFQGNKLILYYEDMLQNKIEFVNTLYSFLNINNEDKKEYIINNIEQLFVSSLNGKGRAWKGVMSNGELDFYYKQIPPSIKTEFDKYILEHISNYPLLMKRYI